MITQERLKQLVVYNPSTGHLICAMNRKGSKNKIGDVLGSKTKSGHVELSLDGRRYFVRRLAFVYMTGEEPKGVVDHINRDPGDNRWANLREVTQVENGHNQNRLPERNSTGYVGVHRCNGKYRAKVVIGQRQVHLGTYDEPDLAAAAYAAAKAQLQPVLEAA